MSNLTIANNGYFAGSSNTNANGLSYEKLTDLSTHFTIIKNFKFSKIIIFDDYDTMFIRTTHSNFFKCMNKYIDKTIDKGHGCKNPDECYIDLNKKNIFIIEKKFQEVNGSVCEKIQSPDFKIWQYKRTFPNFNIIYIYCLSYWFKLHCKAEIQYFSYKNIPYFWGNSSKYKRNIINFIINYK